MIIGLNLLIIKLITFENFRTSAAKWRERSERMQAKRSSRANSEPRSTTLSSRGSDPKRDMK